MTDIERPYHVLPIIVFSQFAGASLWFAGNAIIGDLQSDLGLPPNSVASITSSVQFGFIVGTLLFAFLTISDRFSPVKVFFFCSLLGALANISVYLFAQDFFSVLAFRFITGFFLAGIYPVGMKISSDWYEKGLGKALGFLVGALVLGTAFPHMVRDFLVDFPWQYVLIFTSILACTGGILMILLVKDGPFRKPITSLDLAAFFKVFRSRDFRSAAFGYFGHMWELFTFWAFVPFILIHYSKNFQNISLNFSLMSFVVIGVGGISCVIGGFLSEKYGSNKIAFMSLLISGLCCIALPFMMEAHIYLFTFFLLIWGMSVVSDSPQFSTLVARTADSSNTGTALTIVNCVGFAITIVSLQFTQYLIGKYHNVLPLSMMVIGPIFGMISFYRLIRRPV